MRFFGANSWLEQYDYDNLNRLQGVSESSGGTTLWRQEYVYDRYGNRTIHQTNTWGSGIPKPNFGVATASNRLTPPAGYTMSYDVAGNLTNDTYTGAGSRTYDAENRMTQAWANGQWQYYTYDGGGQRVRRKVNSVETWQVYGIDNELLAEYAQNGVASSAQQEYGYRNGQLLITAESPSTPVNLALNKPATQSSLYTGSSATANLAVDGNTSGNWGNGSVTATNYDAQAWWQVDLGAIQSVQSVEVWNRTDCCSDRLTNFNVILLDASQTVISNTNFLGQAGAPTNIAVTGTARYVKVQLVGTNVLSLAEVKVYGTPVPGISNLALNKTAIQSTTYGGSLPEINPVANLAVDGNTNGNYGSGLVATTNNEAQAWWQVDLGATAAVSSVEVWNRTDCCPERLSNFNVMLLDANQATVASVNVTGPGGTPTTVAISGAARYVKVQLVGTNFLSLAEVKVWGTAAGAANINWLVTDQLGTPRMIFDKTGSLATTKRHDYLPFGEEIFAGTGGRTTAQGYSVADGVRQKFTQKERDNETGLDYFGARYYASVQGRFTSVDSEGPNPANPQTFNKYRYALNNPLRYVDPDGRQEKEAWYKPILDYLRTVFGGTSNAGYPESSSNTPPRDYSPMGLDARKLTEAHFKSLVIGSRATANVISTLDPTGGAAVVQNFMEGNTKGAILAGALALPNLFGVSKAALTSGELLIGSVGKAEVAAQFSKSGETLTADVVGVFGAKESGLGSTTKQLLASIMGFAKDEGLKEVRVQAVAVVNKDLERRLIKQGWQVTSVKVGDETVTAFTRTFAVK